MNLTLDISTNPNEMFENDAVIINLNTEEVTFKPGMYTPKYADNIKYHLKVRNTLTDVNYRRELLVAMFEKMTQPQITMLEIGDYEKLADELLGN
jgi:hypothetical protein